MKKIDLTQEQFSRVCHELDRYRDTQWDERFCITIEFGETLTIAVRGKIDVDGYYSRQDDWDFVVTQRTSNIEITAYVSDEETTEECELTDELADYFQDYVN